MRYFFLTLSLLFLFVSCKQDEVDPAALTGKSVAYPLFMGAPEWGYEGEAIFAERVDGFALLTIELNGPEGTALFPAHLHIGPYSTEADMAAMLTPVDAGTGRSETVLKQLADGTSVSYDDMISFNGHIKVHLGDGDDRSVILAYGNIGSNPVIANRAIMANCESW